jgi:hypothetical protein
MVWFYYLWIILFLHLLKQQFPNDDHACISDMVIFKMKIIYQQVGIKLTLFNFKNYYCLSLMHLLHFYRQIYDDNIFPNFIEIFMVIDRLLQEISDIKPIYF